MNRTLALLLAGVAIVLIWAGVRGDSPRDLAAAILAGGPGPR